MTCLLTVREKAHDKALLVLVKDHNAGYTVTNEKLCVHTLYEVDCVDLDDVLVAVDNYEATVV